MARSLSVPYSPAPVPRNPDDLPRYLEDEFQRIRQALIAQPVAFTISEDYLIAIDTVENWQTVFIGVEPFWDIPGGGWDSTTGLWTCPQSGLYQLSVTLEVQAFGGGNKNYYAGLAIVITGEDPRRLESIDGGDDDVPLGVSLMGQVFLWQGDTLRFEATVVHENGTGNVDATVAAQVLRVSS